LICCSWTRFRADWFWPSLISWASTSTFPIVLPLALKTCADWLFGSQCWARDPSYSSLHESHLHPRHCG
jgi:hypothetical protein